MHTTYLNKCDETESYIIDHTEEVRVKKQRINVNTNYKKAEVTDKRT